jgi:hypothetical protein
MVLYSCVKVKKSSSKATYAAKNAPLFCEIWFIYKGKHVWTREASEGPNSLPLQPEIKTAEPLRSMSFQYSNNNAIHPEFFQSNSARSTSFAGSSNWFQGETVHVEVASLPTLSHSSRDLQSSFTSLENNSAKRIVSSISDPNVEEESLYGQLTEARIEAEAATNEVSAEIIKRKKLESEAIKTISKVSMNLMPILRFRDLHFTILWFLGVRVQE